MTRRGLTSRLRERPGREAREARRARQEEREVLETLELRARIEQRWAESRDARRAGTPDIRSGDSNFRRAQVPYGVDLAAAWGWRLIVIGVVGLAVLYLLQLFMVVVLPLIIALLLTALVLPLARRLDRLGLPRSLSALLVVVVLLAVLSLLVTFVSSSIVDGAGNLNRQVADGLSQIRTWLREGPLQVTDSQISTALSEGQAQLQGLGEEAARRLAEVGTALGHVVAGLFIGLFATYFFLADGARIWAWVVRLFPRAGRVRADSSGRVAWASLTQFVRATVIVAAVDAAGIALGALVLGVPFVGAIAVLVFLGAFVPLVGAAVSGAVAVLVALVAQGPVTALLMLAVVVAVQQVEAHVLQPFLMGRFVSVHPLGVIVAIAMGVLVAGVVGALVAVPLAASVNAVVHHLSSSTRLDEPGDDPGPELGEEPT